MIYNIHPIIVHFPIALLFLYSLIKIIPFKKWFPKISWKQIEILLLTIGIIGALVANSTGEVAQHLINKSRQIIRIHSTFAEISTFIYGLILIGEILPFFTLKIIPKLNSQKITNLFIFIQKILTDDILVAILAFLGLIAIAITGLLGGVIVYGVSADQIAILVLKILGLSY